MVPMRRKERMMEEKNILEVVKDCQYAVLSMINCREDYPLGIGAPYSVPISPVLLDGNLYFHCAFKGHKIENLAHDNKVCVSCVGQADNDEPAFSVAYTSVLVFALAFEVVDLKEKQKALSAICEKFAPSQKERIDTCVFARGNSTAVWRLEPLEMSGKQRKFESPAKV